jgi:DNA-binding NarL/FixJ family response regulator
MKMQPGNGRDPAVTSTNIRALVVDDNHGVCELIRALARRDGVEIVADAENGREAIEQARRHQPDVVLLDVEMPVLDGISAIPGILGASPTSKILMFSVFTEWRDEALAAGAHGWISKGTPWQGMKEAIEAALAAPVAS